MRADGHLVGRTVCQLFDLRRIAQILNPFGVICSPQWKENFYSLVSFKPSSQKQKRTPAPIKTIIEFHYCRESVFY